MRRVVPVEYPRYSRESSEWLKRADTVAECRAQIERIKKTGIQQIAIIR